MRRRVSSVVGLVIGIMGGLMLLAAGAGVAMHLALRDYGRGVAAVGRMQERAYLTQRIDAGVYAAVMESRGLYMARNAQESERFAAGLRRHLADIARDTGRRGRPWSMRSGNACGSGRNSRPSGSRAVRRPRMPWATTRPSAPTARA